MNLFIEQYPAIAHRGLYYDEIGVPENSLEAFLAAMQNGYAIELDVHLTKDNKIVVFHDNNLERMTGINKKIESCELAYLETLTLKQTKSKIPTLLEVLQLVEGKVPILIEIKNEKLTNRKLEKQLMEMLASYVGEYMVESFNPLTLYWLKRHYPEIARGQLSTKQYHSLKEWAMVVATNSRLITRFTKPDFIAYHYEDFDRKVRYRFRKKKIILWTIANEQDYIKAKKQCHALIFEHIFPKEIDKKLQDDYIK